MDIIESYKIVDMKIKFSNSESNGAYSLVLFERYRVDTTSCYSMYTVIDKCDFMKITCMNSTRLVDIWIDANNAILPAC